MIQDGWFMDFSWNEKNQLELGPFQGPVACTLINFGKGVCGSAWERQKSIIVPDVHQFEGHIACSSVSNSEIVVPFFRDNKIIGVLDIDSEHFNHFDTIDQTYLEKLLNLLN
jgi:GAF domain-containing protein